MILNRQLLCPPLVLFAALVIFALETGPASGVEGPQIPRHRSVDQISGLGKYKFGAKYSDFPKDSMAPVDPNAKSGLLRVSPYGDNYLVSDIAGLTWGNIPVTGLVVTFHGGVLVDLQIALKTKNIDLYTARRAFKEKYGDSDTEASPVETWTGDKILVTMIFVGADPTDVSTLSDTSCGRVDIFDQALWKKFDSAEKAKIKDALDKEYETSGSKARDNL